MKISVFFTISDIWKRDEFS